MNKSNEKSNNYSSDKEKEKYGLNKFNALTANSKSIHKRNFDKTGYGIRIFPKSLINNK